MEGTNIHEDPLHPIQASSAKEVLVHNQSCCHWEVALDTAASLAGQSNASTQPSCNACVGTSAAQKYGEQAFPPREFQNDEKYLHEGSVDWHWKMEEDEQNAICSCPQENLVRIKARRLRI